MFRPVCYPGVVYLVGAGPGDPGLLTLRGAECLAAADVVLYDYLANPRLLAAHARPGAELISLGAHGQSKIWKQEAINARLVAEARAGKVVVRLKGGDPAIFGRLAEETAALAAAQVRFEIVPGVTAASAVGCYLGIPLTDRECASAVALFAGHEDADKTAPALDYAALAKFPGTLVVYMGVTQVATWTAGLLAAGKSPDTPAVCVRRCTLPDQRTIRTTLGQLAATLTPASQLRPPVTVIVGDVAHSAGPAWFEQRPLWGQRILITRATDQLAELRAPLESLGAEVIEQPAIEILDPPSWQPVDDVIGRLAGFDWLVFSSSSGVQKFMARLAVLGRTRALASCRLAAIGPGTAERLAQWKLRADVVPPEYRAESLAAVLAPQAQGQRFLLVRASRGRDVLAHELLRAGAAVEQVVAYESRDVIAPKTQIQAELERGEIHWVTVTSSAIARSLAGMFGDSLQRARLASISPITSATLRELGFVAAAEATTYTLGGLVDAMVAVVAHESHDGQA